MELQSITTHRIDAEDRLVYTDDGWREFAIDNHYSLFYEQHLMGYTLWSFISDKTLIHLYQSLLHCVRLARKPAKTRYRCDSPGVLREFEMTIRPLENGGAEFENRLIRISKRPMIRLLDIFAPRGPEWVTMCSRCKAIKTPGGWQELEQAALELSLFQSDPLPEITHGLCEACYEVMLEEIETFKEAG
ncbi:MAG: hypothetical protein GC154_03165 [bacterium]|nr:hypothetical protein [bacterium]